MDVALNGFCDGSRRFCFIESLSSGGIFRSFIRTFTDLLRIDAARIPLSRLVRVVSDGGDTLRVMGGSPALHRSHSFIHTVHRLIPSFPPRKHGANSSSRNRKAHRAPAFSAAAPRRAAGVRTNNDGRPSVRRACLPRDRPSAPPRPAKLAPRSPTGTLSHLHSGNAPLRLAPLPRMSGRGSVLARCNLSTRTVTSDGRLTVLQLRHFLVRGNCRPIRARRRFTHGTANISARCLGSSACVRTYDTTTKIVCVSPSI